MGTVEIILLVIGIICVIVGIILGITDGDKNNDTGSLVSDYDAANQVSRVSQTIDSIIEKKIQDMEDKTEARLDKISNTKILEMNEYADGVLNEINRNHNEVMFMYDMLNEKDKEIKTTVKDVNVTRKSKGLSYNDEKSQGHSDKQKNKPIHQQSIDDFVLEESLSVNEKIMKLYYNGYKDVDIAKKLKKGVGEVRLVINLSSGNN